MFNDSIKVLEDRSWDIIANEYYDKFYAKFMLRKDKSKKLINEKNESLSTNFKLCDSSEANSHIFLKLNQLLNKDFILITWTCQSSDEDPNTINGLTLYNCKLKNPILNSKSILKILKNSIDLEIKKTKLELKEEYLINIKYKIKNIFDSLDLSTFEIKIEDEEQEFKFIGLKKFKIFENKQEKEFVFDFNVILSSNMNLSDINKFVISLFLKGQDKPLILNNMPGPIIIDLN